MAREKMASERPAVSVVIPTYNRRAHLLRTLDSLCRQTFPAGAYEVVVVDDGGSDGTEEVAEHNYPFDLRYVRQPNQGDAVARNMGAVESRGELLIFLDDDITVVPAFIGSLVKEHEVEDWEKEERRIVIGTLKPELSEEATLFEQIYTQVRFDQASTSAEIDFTSVLSGILSVKRQEYLALGMMQPLNEDGSSVWCDVEFAYRAQRQGYLLRRSQAAVGYHRDYAFQDLEVHCRRMFRAGKVAVMLLQKYPELEELVPLFRDRSFPDLDRDSWQIAMRKLWRSLMAQPAVLWSMKQLIRLFESTGKPSAALRRLYIWYVSSAVTRGMRQGIREYGGWR